MRFHKSTLVARRASTQLDPSCVSAPLATNVNLYVLLNACLNHPQLAIGPVSGSRYMARLRAIGADLGTGH